MRNVSIALLCLIVASCSSPVEKYIKNDFARVVREDGLKEEIKNEENRFVDALEEMVSAACPEQKASQELMAQFKKMESDITSRLNSYKRTGDYGYIYGIGADVDKAEAIEAKANRLSQKARPYINHKTKQIKAFRKSFENLDGLEILYADDNVKIDSVEQSIFKSIIGYPDNMITASPAQMEESAEQALKSYFAEHPTPTVKTHKYKKDSKCWFITLSDGSKYLLSATKTDDGEYEYEYEAIGSDALFSPKSSAKSSGNNVGSKDCDKYLDKLEKFAKSYSKSYKKLMKKAESGDISVLVDIQKLTSELEKFEQESGQFEGKMSDKQLERYTNIMLKISEAALGE